MKGFMGSRALRVTVLPKRLLVGYDGSKESEKALDYAVDLAKASGGTLVVQHVLSIGPEAYEGGVVDLAGIETALGKMLDAAAERARTAGVSATKVLSRGDVAATILGRPCWPTNGRSPKNHTAIMAGGMKAKAPMMANMM